MAHSEQPKFYWRWPYRVFPALLTIPLAVFFTAGAVGLLINVFRDAKQEGWSAELIGSGILGLVVLGIFAVGFTIWSIATLRAGRFTIGDSEISLPRLPLSPFAFFPRKVLLSRIVDIDFDEEAVQANQPPVVKFVIKMAEPMCLRLSRYPRPDLVHEYLRTHLSHLEPEKGE